MAMTDNLVNTRQFGRVLGRGGIAVILVCCLAAIAAGQEMEQGGQRLIILTFDVSGSLETGRFMSAESHQQVVRYVEALLYSGYRNMKLRPGDNVHFPVSDAAVLNPLFVAGTRWAAFAFGGNSERDGVKLLSAGEAGSLLTSQPLTPAMIRGLYPTVFLDDYTFLNLITRQVCSMSDPAIKAGIPVYWLIVTDDLLEAPDRTSGEEITALRSLYDINPLINIKVWRGEGKAYQGNQYVYVQVRQVMSRLRRTVDQSLEDLARALRAAQSGNLEQATAIINDVQARLRELIRGLSEEDAQIARSALEKATHIENIIKLYNSLRDLRTELIRLIDELSRNEIKASYAERAKTEIGNLKVKLENLKSSLAQFEFNVDYVQGVITCVEASIRNVEALLARGNDKEIRLLVARRWCELSMIHEKINTGKAAAEDLAQMHQWVTGLQDARRDARAEDAHAEIDLLIKAIRDAMQAIQPELDFRGDLQSYEAELLALEKELTLESDYDSIRSKLMEIKSGLEDISSRTTAESLRLDIETLQKKAEFLGFHVESLKELQRISALIDNLEREEISERRNAEAIAAVAELSTVREFLKSKGDLLPFEEQCIPELNNRLLALIPIELPDFVVWLIVLAVLIVGLFLAYNYFSRPLAVEIGRYENRRLIDPQPFTLGISGKDREIKLGGAGTAAFDVGHPAYSVRRSVLSLNLCKGDKKVGTVQPGRAFTVPPRSKEIRPRRDRGGRPVRESRTQPQEATAEAPQVTLMVRAAAKPRSRPQDGRKFGGGQIDRDRERRLEARKRRESRRERRS